MAAEEHAVAPPCSGQWSGEVVAPPGSASKSAPRPKGAYSEAQPGLKRAASGFDRWRQEALTTNRVGSASPDLDDEQAEEANTLKDTLWTTLHPTTALGAEVDADFFGWQMRLCAEDLQMPLESVALAKDVFNSFDFDGSGALDFGELEAAALRLLQLTTTGSEPIESLKSVAEWGYWDTTNALGINFEEFMKWYASNCFQEDILLPVDQQELRRIAKKHGCRPDDVERVKKIFDTCTNNVPEISYSQFSPLIHTSLSVPMGEIPESRLRFFWSQIDADHSGKVCFAEYFDWWHLYFPKEAPYSEFYRQVRRIGKEHLDPSPYDQIAEEEALAAIALEAASSDKIEGADEKDQQILVRLSERLRGSQKHGSRHSKPTSQTQVPEIQLDKPHGQPRQARFSCF